jgi:hypothetical protein
MLFLIATHFVIPWQWVLYDASVYMADVTQWKWRSSAEKRRDVRARQLDGCVISWYRTARQCKLVHQRQAFVVTVTYMTVSFVDVLMLLWTNDPVRRKSVVPAKDELFVRQSRDVMFVLGWHPWFVSLHLRGLCKCKLCSWAWFCKSIQSLNADTWWVRDLTVCNPSTSFHL